jgi:hypothetical protein
MKMPHQFRVVRRPEEVVERTPGTRGFSILPRRWVVERTLSLDFP